MGVACPKVCFFIERRFQGILLLFSGEGRRNDGVEIKTKDRGKMFCQVETTNKTNTRRIMVNLKDDDNDTTHLVI